MTTYVLIPGACHGAWCFDDLAAALRNGGSPRTELHAHRSGRTRAPGARRRQPRNTHHRCTGRPGGRARRRGSGAGRTQLWRHGDLRGCRPRSRKGGRAGVSRRTRPPRRRIVLASRQRRGTAVVSRCRRHRLRRPADAVLRLARDGPSPRVVPPADQADGRPEQVPASRFRLCAEVAGRFAAAAVVRTGQGRSRTGTSTNSTVPTT